MRPTDRMNGVQARLACGCYTTDDSCECDAKGSPDPWLIAGEDVNLNRKAETRSYRQSKFRT
jgi:hypothetical protein